MILELKSQREKKNTVFTTREGTEMIHISIRIAGSTQTKESNLQRSQKLSLIITTCRITETIQGTASSFEALQNYNKNEKTTAT